ncbi:hypothetical protein F3Y22_tig00111311pilonHSYRG00137 [Hibiscus syriacus]|uniref:Uncharacterized protein n=1 Tax=Hibiscus syriacus TaxID=106335 RepID=A0A6A2YQS5_HIBSY|nr:hypothetical protein F3Y22_tig00111311pilonHSYRG00137 [Hibiscus syriacus]
MWHGLTAGESVENVEIIFADIRAWLDRRSTTLERFLEPFDEGATAIGRTQSNGGHFSSLKGPHSAMYTHCVNLNLYIAKSLKGEIYGRKQMIILQDVI